MGSLYKLTKGISTLSDLADGALASLPFTGNKFFVDPINGNNANDGELPGDAMKTVPAAYAKTVDGQNDVVMMIGGATADLLTAALTWSKNYTHLIGLSANLPGVGQRCRITGGTVTDLTRLVTFSGSGCIVRNVQFFNGADANADAGAVIVSGGRNEITNCMFAGMGHATPAARAGCYSLKVTGDENAFIRCSIGLATIVRSGANAELWLTGECNRLKFIGCEFLSWSNTAGKFLVLLDANAVPYTLQFEDCLFNNFCSNGGATGTFLGNAISDLVTPYHQIILRGSNPLVGVTGYADTVTYVYSDAPAPNAGYGVSVNPTT